MMSCVSSVAADTYGNITAELDALQQLLEQENLSDKQRLNIQTQVLDLLYMAGVAKTQGELTQEQYSDITDMIEHVKKLYPNDPWYWDPTGGPSGILPPTLEECEDECCNGECEFEEEVN